MSAVWTAGRDYRQNRVDLFALIRQTLGSMASYTADTESRVVKVPFPVSLIRRMDQTIVAGAAGFSTRAELMREAVENLLNELEFPEAPPEPMAVDSPSRTSSASVGDHPKLARQEPEDVPTEERNDLVLGDLADTALRVPAREPHLLSNGVARVRDEPLLGLHNRDYVTIWALHRLARYTQEGPVPWDEFLRRVTRAAWFYGSQLQTLERHDRGRKLTVLFPTNPAKQPSAERGFQTFALGGIARKREGPGVSASGPLFAWGAIQVISDDGLLIAITEQGWNLMQDLHGISLELPHAPGLASRFLAYIKTQAPADRWGFDHLLRASLAGPDRDGLVEHFAAARPEWTLSMASSVVQGYVARSREWGLLEPRLVEGRYWLTDAGRELAEQAR
jgi:hypothetical protein